MPIIALYDADRYRWDQLKQWVPLYPHVFEKPAIAYSKDYRIEAKQRILDAVKSAKRTTPPRPQEPSVATSGLCLHSGRMARDRCAQVPRTCLQHLPRAAQLLSLPPPLLLPRRHPKLSPKRSRMLTDNSQSNYQARISRASLHQRVPMVGPCRW